MVLGWGKKTVTKADEEDMTMDEILASIRRYVTEDQNATQDLPPSLRQPSPHQQEFADSMVDYNEPYSHGERDLSSSLTDTSPSTSSEGEMNFKPESTSPSKTEGLHPHFSETGITSTKAISAAAMALSKLEEVKIKTEHQALEAMGDLTLNALITNLARPMIKEWLDQSLPQIVEAMVEREIERIRNYSSK